MNKNNWLTGLNYVNISILSVSSSVLPYFISVVITLIFETKTAAKREKKPPKIPEIKKKTLTNNELQPAVKETLTIHPSVKFTFVILVWKRWTEWKLVDQKSQQSTFLKTGSLIWKWREWKFHFGVSEMLIYFRKIW